IPDIILTGECLESCVASGWQGIAFIHNGPSCPFAGPNNLDELQSTNDFVKDLNNSMVNMNSSFDSDIFCSASEELRTGTFDSFDLDNLPILNDIDTNTE